MNIESYPALYQRITSITTDSVQDACSAIGSLVYKMGLVGVPALVIEQELYTGLYRALVELKAPAAALEYVEGRRSVTDRQLDNIKCGAPDLFDDEKTVQLPTPPVGTVFRMPDGMEERICAWCKEPFICPADVEAECCSDLCLIEAQDAAIDEAALQATLSEARDSGIYSDADLEGFAELYRAGVL